jgi:simple sugar transport system ATP-binding protein
MLCGFLIPDSGSIRLNGDSIPYGQPSECKRRGIEMIHQHFTLVSNFTVAENFALARLPNLAAAAKIKQRSEPSFASAARLGWDIDRNAIVRDLSVGAKQRTEILKALGGDASVVIFDEPTAVLSREEVQDLFRVLRQLRDEGKIIILIAHKLSEVLAVADRVTVLRRGRKVAEAPIADVNAELLAEWMVGELPAKGTVESVPGDVVKLQATSLSVLGDRGELAVNNCDFIVRAGEVFGIGGVDGNGQLELAEAIVGIRPYRGEIRFNQKPHDPESLRIGYVPQDRHHDGLALTMTIEENMLITGHRRSNLAKMAVLDRHAIRNWAESVRRKFAVKSEDVTQLVSGLSGGNQQKIVVGRALDEPPQLLVVMSPTRGLDIRATEFVHQSIRDAKKDGTAIVLITTDLEELFQLSDRVQFMSRGELREGDDSQSLLGGAS